MSSAESLGGWRQRPARGELALLAAVNAAAAGLLIALGPAPADAPAHLYRIFLVEHASLVWDNFWYAGHYPLFSYSLLYYFPAAVVGNTVLAVAASIVTALLFSSIAHREWGSQARWPSWAFGVLAVAPLFTGLFSYAAGLAALLATLQALQSGHLRTALAGAALTLGLSPLAFVFLCLVLGALALSRRRLTRRVLLLGAGVGVVAAFQVVTMLAFPASGVHPFHVVNLAGVLIVSSLGALLARRASNGGVLLVFFLLWGSIGVVAFSIPTPIGDNWTRLGAFAFPLMLLSANLARFRPRRLVVLALAAALAYNLAPYVLLVPSRFDARPDKQAFWEPPLAFLRLQLQPGYRVEVVPTAAHWESYWLPRAGIPLARGWYRQLDVVDNPQLYASALGPHGFSRWLRSMAVEYVVLAPTALDSLAAPREASLLRSGRAGLPVAFRRAGWTVYRVPGPTPLVTGPGAARITTFGHTTVSGIAAAPGRYLLRVRWTRYWSFRGAGCVTHGPGRMTWLELSRGGAFSLSVSSSPRALLQAATDPDVRCRDTRSTTTTGRRTPSTR